MGAAGAVGGAVKEAAKERKDKESILGNGPQGYDKDIIENPSPRSTCRGREPDSD